MFIVDGHNRSLVLVNSMGRSKNLGGVGGEVGRLVLLFHFEKEKNFMKVGLR